MCRNERNIEILIGPDLFYVLADFNFPNQNELVINFISLDVMIFDRPRTVVSMSINLDDNSFISSTENTTGGDFYFYVIGKCPKCFSFINSVDVEKKNNLEFFNIGIDVETFFVPQIDPEFDITFGYDELPSPIMEASKLIKQDSDGNWERGKFVRLPFIELDFSNEKSIVEMINTFITFS